MIETSHSNHSKLHVKLWFPSNGIPSDGRKIFCEKFIDNPRHRLRIVEMQVMAALQLSVHKVGIVFSENLRKIQNHYFYLKLLIHANLQQFVIILV